MEALDLAIGPHKASRLVLYIDLVGERLDPAMEAPDQPSKEGNKHRSTLGTDEGKRGGAGREATFTCVCSRRSPACWGRPWGPPAPPHGSAASRASIAAPPRLGGRTRATTLGAHAAAPLRRGTRSPHATAPPRLGCALAPLRLPHHRALGPHPRHRAGGGLDRARLP
jgi:hypothetical protein